MKPSSRWCAIVLACLWCLSLSAQIPVAGPNVNMVSGTGWPGGDPFLQRQNEPSVAVSTRNPSHLLGGANDYRTVDLSIAISAANGDAQVVGDAWLGLFKSFDAGQTWSSTLLPGCRYAVAQCQGSPVTPSAYDAGSDPVVRAGSNGMFFYSALAFDRTHGRSAVFVSRFIDDNNRERSVDDTIRFLDASIIDQDASGQFIDKPWIAVDVPRPGAATCSIPASGNGPAQMFAAGTVYVAYARFTGRNNSSQIYISRSTDCGVTWSKPTKVSAGSASAQGATLAIDPNSGAVYVAWRRFRLLTSQPNSILVAKSTDGGKTFGQAVTVANILPFDLNQSTVGFRTLSFPTLGVDAAGLVYAAWAGRQTAGGDARIILSVSRDGGSTWPAPQIVETPQPLSDDSVVGTPPIIQPGLGHQLMPSIGIVNGKVAIIYYSLYEDSTTGLVACPPASSCSTTAAFLEYRNAAGNLAPAPQSSSQLASVFTSGIADVAPAGDPALTRRHTLDVRVALANAGATPSFTSTLVSRYLFGNRSTPNNPSVKTIQQLRFNVPNLPLFVNGTEPFMGDYLDLAAPAMVPGAAAGSWTFNTSTSVKPQFHAAWTDNRDVRPPADGDWTHYTPLPLTGYSVGPTLPACIVGEAGMRNQNIYTSRITEGLLVTAPGNSKQLSTTLQRAFSVVVQNNTNQVRYYRLTIANQPLGGQASFVQTGPATTTLDATIPQLSSISRSVFVTSSDPRAQVTVNVVEITGIGGSPASGGQSTSVLLNPDLTNPDLTNPDLTNGNIQTAEIYIPDLTNPDLTNPDLTNPDLTNPDLTNPDLTNPDLTNPDLTNLGLVSTPVTNPDLTNPDLTNPNLTFTDISANSLTDATWKLTNRGNTTASFKVRLVTPGPVPANFKIQLLVNKSYAYPAVSLTSASCQLTQLNQNILVANILNPVFFSPTSPDLTNPDLTNPDPANATVTLEPGEIARISLRIWAPTKAQAVAFATSAVQPVVISQGVSTGATGVSVALAITTLTLPGGAVSSAYNATVTAIGGTGARTWSISAGALPTGLMLNASTGVISGTPTAVRTFNFTVNVVDSGTPQQTDSRALSIVVVPTTIFTYTGNGYTICSGTYCTGGPYALSVSFTTTLTGSSLANLPFTDISATITSFTFTDGSGLTLVSNLGFLDISTDASGNISTWVVGACGSTCDTQMQTNWNSPFSFMPGRDFSETTASFAGSYGYVSSNPGTWVASTIP
jgi:hypothetical protein